MSLEIIPISEIFIDEDRQRKAFPEQEMEELRASIQGPAGMMTPIFVSPVDESVHNDGEFPRFKLIAGERRLRTISTFKKPYMFGETQIVPGMIPAVVREFTSELDQYEAELHENIVRLDLTWQEKANAIAKLHKFKTLQNPEHKVGMTAKLLETQSSPDSDFARPVTYRQVNNAILVADFLDRPEVQAARSLDEATRITTRILETDLAKSFTNKLKELQANAEAAKAAEPSAANKAIIAAFEEDQFSFLVPEKLIGTFYPGDMREEILKVKAGSVNVVITDPPYGTTNIKNFNNAGNPAGIAGTRHYTEDNYVELHQHLVKELNRVCAPSAHVYIFCDFDFFHALKEMFPEGWRVRRAPIIWNNGSLGMLESGDKAGYRRNFEMVLFATRGHRPGSFVSSDVINVNSSTVRQHADQKPVALYEHFLKMSAVPGDTILDPFAGSGTIFEAAKKTSTFPIGIEMAPEYIPLCQMAQSYNAEKPPVEESLEDLI